MTVKEMQKVVKGFNLENVSATQIAKMKSAELEALITEHGTKGSDSDESAESVAVTEEVLSGTDTFTAKDGTIIDVMKGKFVRMTRKSAIILVNGTEMMCGHPSFGELAEVQGALIAGDEFTFTTKVVNDARYPYPLITLLSSANPLIIQALEMVRENDLTLEKSLNQIARLQVSAEVKVATMTKTIIDFNGVPVKKKLTLSRQ